MKNGVVYIRVSTEEQADKGKSIETQEKLAREWAKHNDTKIVDIYIDKGKSATNLHRPALQDLLGAVQDKSGVIDSVIVQDTDRLARNTLHHLQIKAILQKKNVELISISQPMLDNSPEGNLMDVMIAGFNTFQSQITGRKTSKVLEEKAKMGWYPGGLPPIGYKNAENPSPTTTLDKRIVVLNKRSSSYMKSVLERYSLGESSIQELADLLNAKGVKSPHGKRIHVSTLHNCLRNPFYIGKFEWNGKLYDGNHEHLISKETFDKNQEVLSIHNQNASRKRKHNYLLRGYLFCKNCGARYWAEKHKKKGIVYNFYFCSKCKGSTYADVEKIEEQVEKIFESIQLSSDYIKHVRETANKILKESRIVRDSEAKRFQAERSKVVQAMKEAEDDRFIHKTLTPEAFQRVNERYENELKRIESELGRTNSDYSEKLELLNKILTLSEDIGKSYKTALYPQKRKYLALFIKKILVEGKDIVGYELSDDLKELIENGQVRVRKTGLPREDSNL